MSASFNFLITVLKVFKKSTQNASFTHVFMYELRNHDSAYVSVRKSVRKNRRQYVILASDSTVIDSHGMVLYI